MSVLVNGSVTKDFRMEKGLRKGGLSSSFLFVMAMEGLIGLMNKVVDIRKYSSFHLNEEVSVDILQFDDDAIIIEDGGLENLWGLKAILRGFQMVSGCKPTFEEAFPKVFSREIVKESIIVDACSWDIGDWVRKLISNSDDLGTDAAIEMGEVYRLLVDSEELRDEEDEYCWMADKSEYPTVKSSYSKMTPCLTDLSPDLLVALSIIWKMKEEEDSNHLFNSCEMTKRISDAVRKWTGTQFGTDLRGVSFLLSINNQLCLHRIP
ncbi:hypothetical protein KIW84_050997 [Lathyrus oleraceus]|uniref:Uncharacterized protein n=1 Tax=Pisum sativum TaxID=3888 RepID=A0A9D5AD64_PEA|nr:hypothetical protein KIW84_050997 [Pisum sativum]